MHALNFCFMLNILYMTNFGLAVPFTSLNPYNLHLERGSQSCSNAANHKAGTPLTRRTHDSEVDNSISSTSPPLSRRTLLPLTDTNPTSSTAPPLKIICAPGTSTYTEITYHYPIHYDEQDTDPLELLYDAENGVHQHLAGSPDSLIPGALEFEQDGLTLHVENANNHQLTWGVLLTAVQTLQQYMQDFLLVRGLGLAAISFLIYDGLHQVGAGYLKHT